MKAVTGHTTREILDDNGNSYVRVLAVDAVTTPSSFELNGQPLVIVKQVLETFDFDVEATLGADCVLDNLGNRYFNLTGIQ